MITMFCHSVFRMKGVDLLILNQVLEVTFIGAVEFSSLERAGHIGFPFVDHHWYNLPETNQFIVLHKYVAEK